MSKAEKSKEYLRDVPKTVVKTQNSTYKTKVSITRKISKPSKFSLLSVPDIVNVILGTSIEVDSNLT